MEVKKGPGVERTTKKILILRMRRSLIDYGDDNDDDGDNDDDW